jgi:drug/metabolite transporter (DMT)-like permease
MHKVTGRWKLGLALALVTALAWGVLPIALKLTLQGMDAYTITWYRFAVSGVVLAVIMAGTRQLPSLRGIGRHVWLVLAIAIGGLLGNYVLYLLALDHTSPAIAQVVIQLGPMFFLLGGLLLFKERFAPLQWAGLAALLLGLGLFFNRRLPELVDFSQTTGLGVALMVGAAAVWAAYALAQKQLLKRFGSQQILLLVYLGAIVLLLPFTELGSVRALEPLQAWMLAFSCVNTLVAYGAFAEALEHWEISRVSAVLAITPLITLGSVWLFDRLAPGLLPPEGLNSLSIVGALLVVAGSATCVLSGARVRRAVQPPSSPVAS